MNAIIDFNGYFLAREKFVIKEYSIYLLRSGNNDVVSNFYGVSKPPMKWGELSEQSKSNYRSYFKTYGISWKTGTYGEKIIVKEFWDVLWNTKTVYLLNEGKRDLLANYLDKDLEFEIKYFKDLGFDFQLELQTKCRYHKHKFRNNCANDNVLKMVAWFTQATIDPFGGKSTININRAGSNPSRFLSLRPQYLNQPNRNVVIDFNGYHINDKYVIKEYSLYVIDIKTNDVISNNFEVSGPPVIWEDLDKKSQDNWKVYFNKFGIDWDYGTLDYKSAKQNLQKVLRRSYKIYVIDQLKHQLLLKYFENNPKTSFVYLSNLGFEFKPIMKTTCGNHKQPFKNNCANDNVERMLDWLHQVKPKDRDKSKPEVNNSPTIKIAATNYVIVDFNGYNFPSGFAIKEFNAISATKNGRKANLYLIVKPPYEHVLKMPEYYQQDFVIFYYNHSIDWNTGEVDFDQVSKILNKYFRTATHIYVRSLAKQKLLEKIIGRHNIFSLEDMGFREKPKMSTTCPQHDKVDSICAIDTSKAMLDWFKLNVVNGVPLRVPKYSVGSITPKTDSIYKNGAAKKRQWSSFDRLRRIKKKVIDKLTAKRKLLRRI